MRWRKLGHVFTGNGQFPWMQTHASMPFAVSMGDTVRCYFSTRDGRNRSHVAYVDIDVRAPGKILGISQKPLVSPGPAGSFDDSGVSLSQIVEHGGKRYMYYVGWMLGVTVPFYNSVGLAVAPAGTEDFVKFSPAPVIDRNSIDPLSIFSSWAIVENSAWKIWHGTNTTWEHCEFDLNAIIRYATSADGIHWQRSNHIALNTGPGESAVARPCVIHENGQYHMWYSRRIGRKETSRLGYAVSENGIDWQRRDDLMNLTTSDSGWDSQMICYPCVFDHQGRRYLVYCGNHFGRDGFGLAVLE